MTVMEFLEDRLGNIVFQAVFVIAASVFLLVTGTEAGILLLLFVIWFLFFVGIQTADFFRYRSRLRELQNIMDGLDEKYLFAECVPKAGNVYETKLFDLSRRAGKAMIGAVSDARAAQREYREYVESWIHEIKTPITAAGLICRNANPEVRWKLSRELAQVEAHVERALFYARAESPEKDFFIRQTHLADLVDEAILQYRMLLMQSGIRIETGNMEQTVYTDGKWVIFIIGQLLQNAARYRGDDALVTLSAGRCGKQVWLTVCDNGIGIPAHEISRVWERGFTGSNGRSRGGSTGMGLYLCRRLADCLEIGTEITSEIGRGTKVTLIFPAKTGLKDRNNITNAANTANLTNP